jgi:hypothetical protein
MRMQAFQGFQIHLKPRKTIYLSVGGEKIFWRKAGHGQVNIGSSSELFFDKRTENDDPPYAVIFPQSSNNPVDVTPSLPGQALILLRVAASATRCNKASRSN